MLDAAATEAAYRARIESVSHGIDCARAQLPLERRALLQRSQGMQECEGVLSSREPQQHPVTGAEHPVLEHSSEHLVHQFARGLHPAGRRRACGGCHAAGKRGAGTQRPGRALRLEESAVLELLVRTAVVTVDAWRPEGAHRGRTHPTKGSGGLRRQQEPTQRLRFGREHGRGGHAGTVVELELRACDVDVGHRLGEGSGSRISCCGLIVGRGGDGRGLGSRSGTAAGWWLDAHGPRGVIDSSQPLAGRPSLVDVAPLGGGGVGHILGEEGVPVLGDEGDSITDIGDIGGGRVVGQRDADIARPEQLVVLLPPQLAQDGVGSGRVDAEERLRVGTSAHAAAACLRDGRACVGGQTACGGPADARRGQELTWMPKRSLSRATT
eukprot:scaffold1143_cov25-Tisochrysis_lutea.AAC.2